MEPWPFSHGYSGQQPQMRNHGRAFNGAMALQPWIRLPDRGDVRPPVQPSMEPWPFSHGYQLTSAVWRMMEKPSMEPWPFSHGYGMQAVVFIHG